MYNSKGVDYHGKGFQHQRRGIHHPELLGVQQEDGRS